MGSIKVTAGEDLEERIEEELKNLVDENWNWQVRKVEEKEYPTKTSLDTLLKISELELGIYNIKVKTAKSNLDPDACASLSTAWMKIYGIPSIAKEVVIVTEIASPAGEPLVVDEVDW